MSCPSCGTQLAVTRASVWLITGVITGVLLVLTPLYGAAFRLGGLLLVVVVATGLALGLLCGLYVLLARFHVRPEATVSLR